ncbi:MAG: actin-related protein 2/3 complex subunit 5 family protein [Myxococcota bacterium]|nr:actin-related protein 2/3 complex subunit 5 family protein [Myxococcota bacterium]
MSQLRLTPATKALLAAAKADAPSASSRATIWGGVARTAGAIAGATSVASVAGGTSAKAVLFGTLFGGTATVGLALALLRFVSAPALPHEEIPLAIAPAAPRATSVSAPALLPDIGASEHGAASDGAFALSAFVTRPSKEASERVVGPPPTAGLPPNRHSLRKTSQPVGGIGGEDALAHEASLIGQARSALARGDAQSALRAIRAAGALPSRQLVPEELAVEARALRSLGRSTEARDVGEMLKAQYPESALAR